MRLLLRLVAVLVILGGLLLLGTELGAKPFAERAIAREVRDEYGLATTPDVSLSGFPFAVQVAQGRLDGATVTIDDYVADPEVAGAAAGLAIRRAVLRMEDVTFDAAGLVDGSTEVRAAEAVLTATLEEAAVSSWLATQGVPLAVHFTPGTVSVDADIPALGTTATATGAVSLAEGALRFEPATVSVGGVEAPPELLEVARPLTTFTLPLPEVAGVEVTTASIGQGAATLTADVIDYVLSGAGAG